MGFKRDGTPHDNLTAEEVRARYSYDPNTGILRHTDYVSNRPHKHGREAGCVSNRGYRMIYLHKRNHMVHRVIWLHFYGEYPPEFIDHINQIKDDNRICNLRAATKQQNNSNTKLRSNNKSGEAGVRLSPTGNRWISSIRVSGVRHFLGSFVNFEDAVAVRRRTKAALDAVLFAINPDNQEAP